MPAENIALRVHTQKIETRKPHQTGKTRARSQARLWYEDWPQLVAVLDCETTIDASQRLTFGTLRVYSGKRIFLETLFYGPQASEEEIQALRAYADKHKEGDIEGAKWLNLTKLAVLDYHNMISLLLRVIYTYGGVLVGFNIPFDIARLAVGCSSPKKSYYHNGFVFHFNEYIYKEDKEIIRRGKKIVIRKGTKIVSKYKPRLAFKSLGEGRNLTSIYHPIRNRKKERGGYIVDLRTVVYALTNTQHTLQSACNEFGVEHSKQEAVEHGRITPEYIDYNRTDVLVTWELYNKLMDEYHHHPIPTKPDRLFSAASLGKGYLKAMGVRPPSIDVETGLNMSVDSVKGITMSAYYAGRSETRIRNTPVPVVYLDFLSEYTTVNVLMQLWKMLTAEKVSVQDDTEAVRRFVDSITLADLYNRKTWRKMLVLARINPYGCFLPFRPAGQKGENYGIYGIDWRYCTNSVEGGLWYALPDVIASKLITGTSPEILQAIRFVPTGRQEGLRPVMLYDTVSIDPYKDDFFRKVIEERKRQAHDTSLPENERQMRARSLKYIAEGISYGSYAELNRIDMGDIDVQVYSKDSFRSSVSWLEQPGAFYFPPVAVLITAAAHLMLAMLQYEVESRGGAYPFMDTDSIAIVSTVNGGKLEITDGEGNTTGIVALSHDEIMQIVAKFERLNPYDRQSVSETLLKLEPENKPLGDREKALSYIPGGGLPEPVTGKDLQGDHTLYSYSVSSKRYALFNVIDGRYVLRKASHILLSPYMSPFGKSDKENVWIEHFWLWEVSGQSQEHRLAFAQSPLIVPLTITTANLMSAFDKYNRGRSYDDSIKPFNFLVHPVLSRSLQSGGIAETDEKPVVLVGAYTDDLYSALKQDYIDINHPGRTCRVVMQVSPGVIDNSAIVWDTSRYTTYIVRSLADYLFFYSIHPEGGMIDAYGKTCTTRTKGLLHHATIEIEEVQYIGKETNLIDQWTSGIVTPGDETLIVYQPDEWENEILPQLKSVSRYKMVKATGIDAGHAELFISGKRRPGKDHLKRIRDAIPQLISEYDEWMRDLLPLLVNTPTGIISKLTGLSRAYIKYLKNVERQPSPQVIEKLREVLKR